jgi:MFS family permease
LINRLHGVWTYENRTLLILCLGGGIAALDAQALFYLSPFAMRDLHITNSQMGLLSAAVLFTWALSGFATSVLSDRKGQRKKYLIAAYLMFGVLSFASGLARTVGMLLVARLLIGFAEGPIVPIAHAIIMAESSPRRRGFNMGVVQSVGSQLVGSTGSPLLLVWLATTYNWRGAFFVAGLPGLAIALLVATLIREPAIAHPIAPAGGRPHLVWERLKTLLRLRNIRLCALLSCFLNAWYFGLLTFMPLYLVRSLHLSPREMSHVMAFAGVGAVLSAAAVPLLSDRFGRKPIMSLFAAIGVLGPIGALVPGAGTTRLIVFVFLGAWAQGVLPLCIGTVPMESTPQRNATASGFIMAFGMIVGGLIGPAVCGRLADLFNLGVAIGVCGVAALAAAATCRAIIETAPGVRGVRPFLERSGSNQEVS